MTNTKAQKGDLIRIIPHDDNSYIGEYYEVDDLFEAIERFDEEGVSITVGSKALYVCDHEYVIQRKAGEEDSEIPEGFEELLHEHYTDKAEEIREQGVPTTQADHIRKAGAELTDLLVRKNHDYGDSFAQQYAKYGLISALIRMDDKMRRLETLLHSEEQAQVSESLSDTLLDLAGYALLAYVETQKK